MIYELHPIAKLRCPCGRLATVELRLNGRLAASPCRFCARCGERAIAEREEWAPRVALLVDEHPVTLCTNGCRKIATHEVLSGPRSDGPFCCRCAHKVWRSLLEEI